MKGQPRRRPQRPRARSGGPERQPSDIVNIYCMALGMHTVVARLLAYSALLLPASNREGFFREFLEDADDRIQSTTEKVLDDETTEDDLIEMQEGIRLEIERLIALARRMISS